MIAKICLGLAGIGAFALAGFGVPVAEVRYEQRGPVKVSEELLRYNTQMQPGQEYDQVRVSADLKSLEKTGYFSETLVRSEYLPDGQMVLTYVVTVRPQVSNVKFEGNKKVSDNEIRNRISVYADQPLNPMHIQATIEQLKAYYAENGYHDTTVVPLITDDPDDPNFKVVTFVIEEKLRYRVGTVTFEGNTVYSDWTLKDSIANRYNFLGFLSFLDMGLLHRSELENDEIRLRNLYWEKGYLDFKVEDMTLTEREDDPEMIDISFTLFEGEPYTVGEIVFSGNSVLPSEELEGLLLLRSGEPYNFLAEEDSRTEILRAMGRFGYADSGVRVTRDADYDTHVVDLEFELYEGEPYRAQVIISGNEVTKDKVIRRELAIQDGDLLDPEMIEISRQRLLGMGYFSKVEVYTTQTPDIDVRDVHFEVEEQRAWNFSIGAEYSDVDSLMGLASISNNNFDITDPANFFMGGGQRLRLAGGIGFQGGGGSLNFTEPWLFDLPLRLDVNGFWNTTLLPQWDEERMGASISLNHKIFDDFTSLTYRYKFEHVRVYHMDILELERDEKRSNVSEFALTANRDTRDSLSNPTEGYYINLHGAVSPRIAGSSDNFYRLEASGGFHYSIFDKAIVWSTRGKIGVVSDFNRSNGAPLYEKYFLGGSGTIRGFPWRSVGPYDDAEHSTGGQTMFVVTTEITHPIWSFIRGAVFCDLGNTYSNPYSFGPGGVNIGVGYGLRIRVPYLDIPVQLDLAYPVVADQTCDPRRLRFHFNIGYSLDL